ncbi:MAG: hypothetical protein A2283_05090 [Lentisphaerae bacterium RIFOXYA12_FULL_48_11]|nr:MAG: hypothetical protein A2283_05090 [Lentisphaerae bacterium RIFOXYA12_FULL_48_11]
MRKVMIGVIMFAAWAVVAEEIHPISVYTLVETTNGHPIEMMLDGNPDTFAELLDDTREGKDTNTLPPCGGRPVTALFVLDMGCEQKVSGMRLVSQKSRWLARMAYNVTVSTCGDAKGKADICVITEKKVLPITFCGESAFVTWAPVTARFFSVRINESDEGMINSLGTYMTWLNNPSRAILGHTFSGDGRHFVTDIAEVTLFDREPEDFPRPNLSKIAYPRSRLEKDWLLQDAGFDDFARAFMSTNSAELEKRMVMKVAKDLTDPGDIAFPDTPGCDPQWKSLYFRLCEKRRMERLRNVTKHALQIVYVKHYTYGCNATLGSAEHVTDDLTDSRPRNWTKGGQLCLLKILPDGSVTNEVLLDKPDGCIRDPNLSYDGTRLVFSMRDSYNDNAYYNPHRWSPSFRAPLPWDAYEKRCGDDYHLYMMDLTTRKITQITRSPFVNGRIVPCADVEPCFVSANRIIFQSTRCEQVMPCHQTLVSNLYGCDTDGGNFRRLAFDGASTFYPQQLNDGRILYTRWEYNDRNARFQQSLLTMNADGTAQMEYYGNNSFYPASLLHFRQVPGTTKIIGIVSGHHVHQKGKLIVIDRRKGTQGDSGIEYVAGSAVNEEPGRHVSNYADDPKVSGNRNVVFIDYFGQLGPQWQYPYAFDENHYLVTFLPEGTLIDKSGVNPNFGIYYQTADGDRELLAYDLSVECSQPVPVMARKPVPQRGSLIDFAQSYGKFYVQNVYVGPGLKGVAAGTIKKLRVVGIEYRPMYLHTGMMHCPCDKPYEEFIPYGGDGSGEAITASGSWDIKHVLGEVDVAQDGSCAFEVPANNGVYFQLLDERGRCVQTMRSWTMVMPGETMACTGCHENKAQVYPVGQGAVSGNVQVQHLRPMAGQLQHPLLSRIDREGLLASMDNYLGVNTPRSCDPDVTTEGFSFICKIQPILDSHCVKCHDGSTKAAGRPNLTGKEAIDFRKGAGRRFSKSYAALTANGRQTTMLNWYSATGRSAMLPPYAQGSTQSKIMEHLEPLHHGVKVSDEEKRLFACWIDLSIPFGGSYAEATTWTPDERRITEYHQDKRKVFAWQEVNMLRAQLNMQPVPLRCLQSGVFEPVRSSSLVQVNTTAHVINAIKMK